MTSLPIAFALGFAGLASLALAMPRHWRQLERLQSHSPLGLRWFGIVALIFALAICCSIWNPARAVPIAMGVLSLGALTVALCLTWAPRRLPTVAAALVIGSGVVALW